MDRRRLLFATLEVGEDVRMVERLKVRWAVMHWNERGGEMVGVFY